MAHYAFLDSEGFVTEVIAGNDETIEQDWEQYYSEQRNQPCKRTSYNTRAGQHLLGGVPFRWNYAGIGFRYREDLDAFISPQPYPSWSFNEEAMEWLAPVPYPVGEIARWSESSLSWKIKSSPDLVWDANLDDWTVVE